MFLQGDDAYDICSAHIKRSLIQHNEADLITKILAMEIYAYHTEAWEVTLEYSQYLNRGPSKEPRREPVRGQLSI